MRLRFLLVLLAGWYCLPLQAQTITPTAFQNPPNSAKPRVWWHWMNGNITKDGIQKDLEWMNRSGIGGFQNFDASLFTPQIVDKRLTYMTPEWKDAFKFTTTLADQLGLEMAIAGSPGWSESGGPWVESRDGMKKYVWSAVRVTGGQLYSGTLPKPPANPGLFQNTPFEDDMAAGQGTPTMPEYYQDVAVVAYKVPAADQTLRALHPRVESSSGIFSLEALTDGDLAKTTYLEPGKAGDTVYVQYVFNQPQTFCALTIVGGGGGANFGFFGGGTDRHLQVSNDGKHFTEIIKIPVSGVPQNTVTFPPTTGKVFRVAYITQAPRPNPILAMAGVPQDNLQPKGVDISEVVLHTVFRINRLEEKAGFYMVTDLATMPTPATDAAVPTSDVTDLTAKMKPDGSFSWEAPAGNWVVLRFGYSLTGRQNHPASPEATGLEVDKMDPKAVTRYFENYLGQYKDATGGLMGKKGLQYVITDSYEAGLMTWTGALPAEFKRRRGYDMTPWMPVLAGIIVQSTDASEQFLWDFRKTIGELVVENHYDLLGNLLHKRGMGRYTESHESGRVLLADGMEVKRNADVPMSAMWTPGGFSGPESAGEATGFQADIRESASVAHLYGRQYVAAESMTAIGNTFGAYPRKLKRTADMEMACGLNRFVIHTSVHQPVDDKVPGLGLGPFGQWFTRHETWANQAGAWTVYLGRSCYLLQQGKFVADVLYYYGEDNNITSLFGQKLPDVPLGYSYDFVNADALKNVIKAQNSRMVTASGMSYRVLVLDENAKNMSVPVLRKIRDLAKAGVVITGVKPEKTPSLSDNQAEFKRLVAEVWESNRPNVYTGKSLQDVLAARKVSADFSYDNKDAELMYVHRKAIDRDMYWIDNRQDATADVMASFRITGRRAELWHPETGKTEKISYEIKDGRTYIPLHFESYEAYFIVFKDKTTVTKYQKPKTTETVVTEVKGPWQVNFQEKRGAPATASFPTLQSWSDNADAGIKYFSGVGTYRNTLTVASVQKGVSYVLDLGTVEHLAEVFVNGKNLGVVWKTPYKVDVTSALKNGDNQLEIRVVNSWVNRLIGDAQPGVTNKITYTTMPFYAPTEPLKPSGLLGPVRLLEKK